MHIHALNDRIATPRDNLARQLIIEPRAGAERARDVFLAAVCALALLGCASADRPLQLISGAGQEYPLAALEQGIEGFVVVRYDVGVDGQVNGARVVSSQPPGVFDDAALRAVRSWRFNAPLVDGERQPATGLQSTLTFKLGDTNAYDDY